MSIEPDGIKKFEELNYSGHAEILIKWIKEHWNVGNPKPKGYKEFLAKKESDFEGLEELDEKQLLKDFPGFDDSSAGSNAFPVKMSMPHIAYDDTQQGRDPLTMLVSNIFSYGIRYGQVLEGVYSSSGMNHKIHHLSHCMSMAKMADNKAEAVTYELQHIETAKIGSNWMTISKEWDAIREEIKAMDWKSVTLEQKDKMWEAFEIEHEEKYGWGHHKGDLESEFGEYVFMTYYKRAY